MHVFGFIVGLVLLVLASNGPAGAQLQLSRPGVAELDALSRSLVQSVDASSLRRKLGAAQSQYRNQCRFRLFRRAQRRCRAIEGRISRLKRQLSSGTARSGRSGNRSYAGRGGFRTICVRVCDGYYYSLSTTGSRRRFKQDAERCAGQYPPGEAVLFYHPFPSDDVSRARSLDGKRYADQEYAFAFRKEFKPHCAARLHKGLAALKARVFAAVPSLAVEQTNSPAEEATSTPTLIPIRRRLRSSDPETAANRAGRFMPNPVVVADAGSMRTVGDTYYFVEASPGPPPTVAGYEPPELVDFRVKTASSLGTVRRAGDPPLIGAY
jgi:hypothetical protein